MEAVGAGIACVCGCADHFLGTIRSAFPQSHSCRHFGIFHRDTTTYYLRVAPWGWRQDAQEIAVPLALYRIIRPGQPVNIHLFSGALHLPWYSLSPGTTSAADR